MGKSIYAIVLSTRGSGESDSLTTLFGPECGKMIVLVRGGRKPRAKLAGRSKPFSEGRFYTAEGRGLPILTGAEITRSHKGITSDLNKLAAGSFWLDLLGAGHWPEDLWEPIFRLVTNSLSLLADSRLARELTCIIEAKILKLSGEYPQVANCASCKKLILEGRALLDRRFECAYHLDCGPLTESGKTVGVEVGAEVLGAIFRLYHLPLGEFGAGWWQGAEVGDVERTLWLVLSSMIEASPKSRRFLEDALGW